MAVVVLLGNLVPSTEIIFPRSYLFPLDHLRSSGGSGSGAGKSRLGHLQDSAFIWSRREPCTATSASFTSSSTFTSVFTSPATFLASISTGSSSRVCCGCCFGDGENMPLAAAWVWCRDRRYRPVAANFASGAGGLGGGGESDDEEEGKKDWEEQLRRRLKELEEMKELERRAEELRSRMMDEEGGEDGETEEEKRERVRKELEKLAKEQAERMETAKLMFELGQKAYGKGTYARAIEFLEGALTIIPRPTLLGGEVQIWLAMAYEANNRHKDCIELYQILEKTHPSVSIRRQAAELRYILQAPKLKISKEEMVTIPLIGSSYDSYAGTWSDKYKDRDQRRKATTTNQSSSKDYWGNNFIEWRPPADWEKSRAFWFSVTLLLALVGVALLQN